jgi:hypothetical protein
VKDIPADHKRLALSMMTTEQLLKVLERPHVEEARKAEVRAEIERRAK